jgi:hypothetical protein
VLNKNGNTNRTPAAIVTNFEVRESGSDEVLTRDKNLLVRYSGHPLEPTNWRPPGPGRPVAEIVPACHDCATGLKGSITSEASSPRKANFNTVLGKLLDFMSRDPLNVTIPSGNLATGKQRKHFRLVQTKSLWGVNPS